MTILNAGDPSFPRPVVGDGKNWPELRFTNIGTGSTGEQQHRTMVEQSGGHCQWPIERQTRQSSAESRLIDDGNVIAKNVKLSVYNFVGTVWSTFSEGSYMIFYTSCRTAGEAAFNEFFIASMST